MNILRITTQRHLKMKNRPKVSIITINYNNELEKTIKSVMSQTCKDYEFLIIDGKSTDGSEKAAYKYKNNIDYFVSEKDSGVYNAMNKGAKKAYGEYLYFLNAGDIFESSDTLGKVVKELDNVDMLYGNIRIVSKDEKRDIVKKKILNRQNIKLGKKVSQQVVFVRRELFNKLGGLDERYRVAADFDLLCKVFENTDNIKYIDEVICDYDDGGISSDLKKSYNDTSKVIKKRYGIWDYILYMLITRLKLIIARFLIK